MNENDEGKNVRSNFIKCTAYDECHFLFTLIAKQSMPLFGHSMKIQFSFTHKSIRNKNALLFCIVQYIKFIHFIGKTSVYIFGCAEHNRRTPKIALNVAYL